MKNPISPNENTNLYIYTMSMFRCYFSLLEVNWSINIVLHVSINLSLSEYVGRNVFQ